MLEYSGPIIVIKLHSDWQLNGKALPSGSKFIPSCDFGMVRLEIRDALGQDAGMFKVSATNSKGSASSSGTLKILAEGTDGPSTISLHPSGRVGLEAIEKMDFATGMKLEDDGDIEPLLQKPSFTSDLPAEFHVIADEDIQLECKVEPKNDSDLRIDWYHNGIPLKTGSRVKASLEFGYVNLQIKDVTDRDQGIYTCKAVNKSGEATTFTKVFCSSLGQTGVDASTMHPRGVEGLESITKVEARGILPDAEEEEQQKIKPTFVTAFADAELEEGAIGHFEAKLEPSDDSDIVLEWMLNGKPLKESKKDHTSKLLASY